VKQIGNYQELSKLIFYYLKKNVMTNCFLSKSDWELEISLGNVYYFLRERNLFILRSRKDFWILNYYLNDLEFSSVNLEIPKDILKPIVVEVVGKSELDEKYQKQQEFFKQLGMEKVLERERFENVKQVESTMKKESDLLIISKNANNGVQDFEIILASNTLLPDVLQFLRCNFHVYYGCIPTEEKLKKDIQMGFVYAAMIEDKIIGVLHFQETDKLAEIRHLAVGEKWRGKGVAGQLMQVYESKVNVQKKIVWTGRENQNAQKLYQKYGYQKDDYVSSVFWYEKREK